MTTRGQLPPLRAERGFSSLRRPSSAVKRPGRGVDPTVPAPRDFDYDPLAGDGSENHPTVYARPQDWKARRSAAAFLMECLIGALAAGFFVFYVAPRIAGWFV